MKLNFVLLSFCSNFILLICILPTSVFGAFKIQSAGNGQPKIWLTAFKKVSDGEVYTAEEEFKKKDVFDNGIVSKNGSNYSFSPNITDSITFECEAGYPIRWNLPFPKQSRYGTDLMTSTEYFRISKFSAKNDFPSNKKFQTRIKFSSIRPSDLSDINLTCVANDETKQNSINIYSTVAHRSNIGNSSNVELSEEFLWKAVTKGNASYNIITHQKGFGSRITFVTEIQCCSGISKVFPSMYYCYCNTSTDCQYLKNNFAVDVNLMLLHNSKNITYNDVNGCVSLKPEVSSVIVKCRSENLDYFQHLVEPIPQITQTHKGIITDQHSFQPFNSPEHFNLKQKMLIQNVKPLGFGGNRWIRRTFPGTITESHASVIKLSEFDDRIYSGEETYFLCIGLKLFYAKGAQIRLNWKNGTHQILEAHDNSTKLLYLKNNLGTLSPATLQYTFGRIPKADLEMESVDCYMPLWNTTEWDKLSKEVEVLQSYPPKISGNATEVLTCNLNDTMKKIKFLAKGYGPTPRTSLTKDGKPFERGTIQGANVNEGKSGGSIGNGEYQYGFDTTIDFYTITKEMAGDYVFTAENVAGKASKTSA